MKEKTYMVLIREWFYNIVCIKKNLLKIFFALEVAGKLTIDQTTCICTLRKEILSFDSSKRNVKAWFKYLYT